MFSKKIDGMTAVDWFYLGRRTEDPEKQIEYYSKKGGVYLWDCLARRLTERLPRSGLIWDLKRKIWQKRWSITRNAWN